MKKVFYPVLLFAVIACSNSNTSLAASNHPDTVIVQEEKTPVKLDLLPDAVRKEIASDKYVGWTPSAAFLIKSVVPYYEVEMIRGEEKRIVKLDEKGQKID